VSTLPSSVNNAAERLSASAIEEKLSGVARPLDTVSEAASAVQTIVSTLISATTEMTI
jgi:hypothetical protein